MLAVTAPDCRRLRSAGPAHERVDSQHGPGLQIILAFGMAVDQLKSLVVPSGASQAVGNVQRLRVVVDGCRGCGPLVGQGALDVTFPTGDVGEDSVCIRVFIELHGLREPRCRGWQSSSSMA